MAQMQEANQNSIMSPYANESQANLLGTNGQRDNSVNEYINEQ